MVKKILFFIVLIKFLFIHNFTFADIVPLQKPSQTKEEAQKKLLIDYLKPLPKPIEKIEIKNVEEKKNSKKRKKKISLFYQKRNLLLLDPRKKIMLKYQNIIVKKILI